LLLPGGLFEREKALENELRSQLFFFNDGDGEQGGNGWLGDEEEIELKLVT
jgi:hypothetical protein